MRGSPARMSSQSHTAGETCFKLLVERGQVRVRLAPSGRSIDSATARPHRARGSASRPRRPPSHERRRAARRTRRTAPADIAREADHGKFAACVDQLRLRAQNEHGQPLLHRRLHVFRDEQTDRVAAAPRQKRREQPAFRRAIAGETRVRGVQVLRVVGQLPVQEARRVVAGRVDHAELRERHVGAMFEHCGELIRRTDAATPAAPWRNGPTARRRGCQNQRREQRLKQ